METPSKTPSNTSLTRGYAFSANPDSPEKGFSSTTKLASSYDISNDPNNSFSSNNGSDNQDNSGEFGQSSFGGKRRRKSKKGGKWSRKYKRSINCRRPKGFSQRQHCKYGRRSRRR